MFVVREPGNGRETILATALLASGLWLAQHPYLGLYQDAAIYALLAARQLRPDAYARDLFFLFGSQDGFSIFSPLYALLIGQVGLDAAARMLVLVGGGLWILACVGISRTLLGDTWYARLCALFLATTSLAYTPNLNTFTLNETIATARQLAIPLGLMSVAFAFAGRQVMAGVAGLVATLIHPLIGIWALVFLLARAWTDRWLMLALGATFAIFLSGHLWLPTDVLDLMEPHWEAVLRASTADVFPGPLGTLRLGQIVALIGVLWLAGRHGNIRFRRGYLLMALLLSMAILLAQICSYFLPIRLVLQVQPWRVMWLAIPIATVAFGDLAGQAWRAGAQHLAAFCVLAALAWSFEAVRAILPYAAIAVMGIPAVAGYWLTVHKWLNGHRPVAMAALVVLALVTLPVYYLSMEIAGASLHAPLFASAPVIDGFFICGGAGLGLAFFAVALGFRPTRYGVLLVSLPLVAYAAGNWDARSPFLKMTESQYLSASAIPTKFGQYIRPGDVVFWPGQGMEVWFDLGTANYAIDRQTTGLVFSARKTAEAMRRLERISLASVLGGEGAEFEATGRAQLETALRAANRDPLNVNSYGDGVPTEAGVAYLCRDEQLDWVVSQLASVAGYRGVSVGVDRDAREPYFLYRCGSLRHG
ncbi:MAG: hypothetical protein Q8M11_22505 [Sulfuritalea sp.]|nr:hypothetical protein [Sulfuritalea sp.]